MPPSGNKPDVFRNGVQEVFERQEESIHGLINNYKRHRYFEGVSKNEDGASL